MSVGKKAMDDPGEKVQGVLRAAPNPRRIARKRDKIGGESSLPVLRHDVRGGRRRGKKKKANASDAQKISKELRGPRRTTLRHRAGK